MSDGNAFVTVRENTDGRWCLVKPGKEGLIEQPLPEQTDDPEALRKATEQVIGVTLVSWDPAPGPEGRRAYVGEVSSKAGAATDAEEMFWEAGDPADEAGDVADMASGDPSDIVDGLMSLEDLPHTARRLKENAGRWARRLTGRKDKKQTDDDDSGGGDTPPPPPPA